MAQEEALQGMVQVQATEWVRPARPSPQPWLSLSPCDVLMRDIPYTRRVLFYERPPPSADDDKGDGLQQEAAGERVVRLLKESLAEALAYFYPLAGRLALREGAQQLAVHCDDQGAEFVRARLMAPYEMRELQACRFDMQPFFCHLARWASYSRSLHEGSAPLLSIQVTTFPCGGIALGVALSHVIADGTSFWHFMNSWAECAQGKTPSLPPLHKRNLLRSYTIPPSSLQKPAPTFFEDIEEPPTTKHDAKIDYRAFCISKEMVEKMKLETKHVFSAYEVASAHIWKQTNKAWSNTNEARVGFINVVNMRQRMNPPLPKGYFGNAILWSIATATSRQLQDENLATTAKRIHDAVVACSNSRMQEFLNLLEVHPCITKEILRPLYCNGARIRVSCSTKFPVGTVNFGWGKPLAVRSASIKEINNITFYPNTYDVGSIVFCLALPTNIIRTLESDPSLK